MREIIVIAGLPGSGKSVLGQELALTSGYLFLDDASRNLDPDRDPVLQLSQHAGHAGLILADPMLCDRDGIANAKLLLAKAFPNVPLRFICFENAPDKCRRNIRARADGRQVAGLLAHLSAVWRPEEHTDCELRAVYSPSCEA